jgi:NADH dehydrogenase
MNYPSHPQTHSSLPHVVIVGGGFGGLSTAKALRGAHVRVTLIDKSNHHLFQPLLYQVATAALSPNDIAIPIRSVFRHQENVSVVMGEVVAIDVRAKQVTLADGSMIYYDFLVIAAGAETNYFGNTKWAEQSIGLKDIDDALDVRQRVLLAFEAAEREESVERRKELLTFVVIGGGPTGVELAGALSELSLYVLAKDFRRIAQEHVRVVLVEMADRVLLPFNPSLSDSARKQLEELDVEVRVATKVEQVEQGGVRLHDEYIPASLVCWTAGVKPSRLAQALGLPLTARGHIPVEQDCSIAGHPEIFAIGDIASYTPPGSDKPLPGVAPVAMQQARLVARNIRRRAANKPTKRFRYVDKGLMATVGRSRAVMEFKQIRVGGLVAWLSWLLVHIWYLIGFRNRVAVLFEWFWAYTTAKRGARIITARSAYRATADWQRDTLQRGQYKQFSVTDVASLPRGESEPSPAETDPRTSGRHERLRSS